MTTIRDRGARAARAARRRGVTFIELIGVLVVAIIIIAGALALYSEANTSSRTNQLVVALGALTGSVRALHANVGRYSSGSTTSSPVYANLVDVLVAANAVPPGMLVTGTAGDYIVRHAFGGHIFVYGVGQEFIITADNLDEDICIRIAAESTAKSSSGLQRVVISGASGHGLTTAPTDAAPGYAGSLKYGDLVDRSGNGTAETNFFFTYGSTSVGTAGLPISPTNADEACASAADSNSISWLYQ